MADPSDPNGGILGLLGRMNNPSALYTGQLSDPATQQAMAGRGLLAMAGSFADSAMPTRMPTPLGAVLGHAAAALGTSGDAVIDARLKAAQSQQALATSQFTGQRITALQRLSGLLEQFSQPDTGDGAAAPIPIPGTIGAPNATTVPDTTVRGPAGVTIPPGTPTAAFDPKLSGTQNLNNLAQAAAPIALPPGYTVELHSGDRPGATVAGTGGPSQHSIANAGDFVIKDANGKTIDNQAGVEDTTGLYGKLALTMKSIADPAIKPWLAWGGNFGNLDIMHYDFGGDRGHRGTLEAQAQALQARPTQLAQANTGTMTDAGPPVPGLINPPTGGAGAVPLGPSGRTTAQLAASLYPNAPGAVSSPTQPVYNPATGRFEPQPRPPAPAGLLAGPQPGAAPGVPLSANTAATLKASGMSDADVARVLATNAPLPAPAAPSGPPAPAAPPPGPPPGPPPSLIPPPPPAPPVPPAAMPQPAAAAPAPQPTAPAAPGQIPGAPSPQRVRLAQQIVATMTAADLPVPAYLAEIASFPLIGPKAAAAAQATLPTEIAKAVGIAAGTYPYDVGKAVAPQTERGLQARTTAGDEFINVPGYGWIQRKNIPGYTIAGGAGGAPAPRLPGVPSPVAAPPGAVTPTPAGAAPSAAPTAPGALLPSSTPAQDEIFKQSLAQTAEQLKPYQVDKQSAPQQIDNADAINDLLNRTKLGWGAGTKNEAAMILQSLGVPQESIKQFTGIDTSAGGALNKLFLQFSSSAVRQMGSREAASVLSLFKDAYPSLESDPNAAQLMTNALRMQAQWKFDRANAAETWNRNQLQNAGQFGQNYRGLEGFDASFSKTNDPHDYWRAAVAMSENPGNIAWKGIPETPAGDAERQRIFDLIPAGRRFRGDDGTPHIKPGAQ